MIAFHNSLIEVPEWGTANLIEILWLFSGLMALSFAGLRIRPLWIDYQLSKRLGYDDLRIIARGYLRREALRVVTAASIIFIGSYTCLVDSVVAGPARVTVGVLIITAALFVISLIVSVNSILDWRDRALTIEIVNRRKNE